MDAGKIQFKLGGMLRCMLHLVELLHRPCFIMISHVFVLQMSKSDIINDFIYTS